MKQPRRTILLFLAALVILASLPVKAEVLDKTKKIGEITVHYKVVLPKNYDAGKTYPGILGFGGGPQTMNVVDSVITRNFRDEAEKRGAAAEAAFDLADVLKRHVAQQTIVAFRALSAPI